MNTQAAKTYRLEGKVLVEGDLRYLVKAPSHYRLAGARQLSKLSKGETVVPVDIVIYRQTEYGLMVVTFGHQGDTLNVQGRQLIYHQGRLKKTPVGR